MVHSIPIAKEKLKKARTLAIDNKIHQLSMDQSSEWLKCVIMGNRYLLKVGGTSEAEQLRYFRANGIFLNKSTIHRILTGKFRTVYTNILFYFVWYHERTIEELYSYGRKVMNEM